jgi:hypothetical protein
MLSLRLPRLAAETVMMLFLPFPGMMFDKQEFKHLLVFSFLFFSPSLPLHLHSSIFHLNGLQHSIIQFWATDFA